MLSVISSFFQTTSPFVTVWIAYSGGVDSHVLLHLMKSAQFPFALRAVHVNHRLNPLSLEWAAHCQKICDALAIPITQIDVDARARIGLSPEAVAREKRYDALSQLLNPNDILVTAHHLDDQAETFLLQLLRGSGLAGLSSMGNQKIIGKGYLVRPLLPFSREAIFAYAKENKLDWIEDNSNDDERFNRNYLRHNVMPMIKTRWPSASQLLSRAAMHCANAQMSLDSWIEEDRLQAQGKQPGTLSVSALLALPMLKQQYVLRRWLQLKNFLLPSEKQLQEIIKTCLLSRCDAMPLVRLSHIELRRYQDDLYAMPFVKKQKKENQVIAKQYPCVLPGVGEIIESAAGLECRMEKGPPCFIGYERFGKEIELSLRYRRGGERFHPAGAVGSRPLKKWMQEWHIPPWERDAVPLLYVNDELVCVVGHAVCPS